MPEQPVTMRRRAHDGTITEWTESGGGIFHPLPEHGMSSPVWVYGPAKAERFFFSCPVSAIDPAVFELLRLWIACKPTRSLPLPGGFLDQPTAVQHAWPVFWDEYDVIAGPRKP